MQARAHSLLAATEASGAPPTGRGNFVSRVASWVTSPATTAPRATVLIRLMAGAVFLSEGILKLVYTNQGIGRFTKFGFPFPDAIATLDGAFALIGGLFLIGG